MTSNTLLVFICYLLYTITAQRAPQWGELECDMSITDRFLGSDDGRYNGYWRYYKLTTSYSTRIRRDIKISTCIETTTDTVYAWADEVGNNAVLWAHLNPWDTDYPPRYRSAGNGLEFSCPSGQTGRIFKFDDVPEGEFDIGFRQKVDTGGKYKVTVECINPSPPSSDQFKSNNVTTPWSDKQTWIDRGSKTISCGANAYGTISSTESKDYYQYEVTDWAQEITFTTCDPDIYFTYDPFDNSGNAYTSYPYSGTTAGDYSLEVHLWNFDGRKWEIRPSANDAGFPPSCTTVTIGDAGSSSDATIDEVSPGIYYVGINYGGGDITDGAYILSMICWDDDVIKQAVPVTNYNQATFLPTTSPITSSPTTKEPTTNNVTTPSPTIYPTETFIGIRNKERKTNNMGDIACGVHRHDMVERKRSNYYTLEVLVGTYYTFDTCMNDMTRFLATIRLYELNTFADPDWDSIEADSTYCNIITGYLNAGTYAIEIYGKDDEEYGEYILRMGCRPDQYDNVAAVISTDSPTPPPTGISPIPPKDGEVVGDISCGITVAGDISASSGDFHKFTIIGGGIDWVRFSTCDETSFENYLFVYDYFNYTGHESYEYGRRDNSIGFHFEDSSTCNTLTMNDLTPGVYYLNIDGFNYFFDEGEYTINMECSDNSAVVGASNYNEYTQGMEWWIILIIVLCCLLCVACILFGICFYYKKKQGADSGSAGNDNNDNDATEMQQTGGE